MAAQAQRDLPADGDPAVADFPVQAPDTRRWCFADQLGSKQETLRGTSAP